MSASPNLPAELELHGSFLRDLSRSLVGDPGLADDLQQDAWTARILSGRRGTSPTDPTETRRWLSTVLRRGASNLRRSGARRSAREAVSARPEAVMSSADAASRMEIAETLLKLVRQLEEPARTAIIARYYEGLDYSEIGAREGCPPSTARSRVQRGLEDLRQRLDREPSGGRETWLSAVTALAIPPRAEAAAGSVGAVAGASWAATQWMAAVGVMAAACVGVALSLPVRNPVDGTKAPAAAGEIEALAATGTRGIVAGSSPSTDLAQVPEMTSQEAGTRKELLPLKSEPEDAPDGSIWQLTPNGEREPAKGAVVTWKVDDRLPPTLKLKDPAGALAALGYAGDTPEVVSAICRADGSYDWPEDKGPDSSDQAVVVEVAEDEVYAGVRWEGTPDEWLALPEPLELVRLPHGTFTGHVVDLDGHPIEGVKLTGRREGGSTGAPVLSKKDGAFAIPALGDRGYLQAESTGWVMCSDESLSTLLNQSPTDPTVVMARAGTLRVDLGDSEEAPGFAVVMVSASETLRRSIFRDATSFAVEAGPDHIAVIDGLPVGQRLVVLTGFDRVYSHMQGGNLVLEPEDDTEGLPAGAAPIVIPESGNLDVRLTHSTQSTIKGTLVDEEGAAVTNCRVLLHAHWRAELGGRALVANAKTDEEGSFQLRWLSTGPLKPVLFVAAPSGGPATRRPLTPAQVKSGKPLRVALASAAEIAGQIHVPDGNAGETRLFATMVSMPDQDCAEVALEQVHVRVQKDGTFTLAAYPGMRCRLLAKHPRFASVSAVHEGDRPGPLEITFDRPSATRMNLELDLGETIRQDLTDLAVMTTPVDEAQAAADKGLRRTRHQVQTKDGVASIQLAPGKHTVEVLARVSDGQRLSVLPLVVQVVDDKERTHRVELVPDLDVRRQIELKPDEDTGDIYITLHRPGSDEALELGTAPSGRRTRFIEVDPRGGFRFRGPVGRYDVRIGTRHELTAGKGRRQASVLIGQ